MRLAAGQPAPTFEVVDIYDNPIALHDLAGQKVMLSFFRYSTCPFCNFRVHQLIKHHAEFEQHGLKILAFWQSPRESVLRDVGKQKPPFPLIADPDGALYARYGVEESWLIALTTALLHPLYVREVVRAGFMSRTHKGKLHTIPADFLLGPDLVIQRAFYGDHIGSHMPIPEIVRFLVHEERERFESIRGGLY
jgi:thioredoxin-dependent peroxiredoxin